MAGVRKGFCVEEGAGVGKGHRAEPEEMRTWNMGGKKGVRAIHESPLQTCLFLTLQEIHGQVGHGPDAEPQGPFVNGKMGRVVGDRFLPGGIRPENEE